jgi:thioredoxin 1
MLSRRHLLAAALVFAAAPALAAAAAYTPAAFEAAQASGAPVLVVIHASWCPTCRAQLPIVERLEADPKFKGLKVFKVDFDAQKDAVRAFGARAQSTLVMYNGGKETGRSVGDTDAGAISALISTAF